MRVLAILMFLTACGDNDCAKPTVYFGAEQDCDNGQGVCVDIGQGAGVECLPKADPYASCPEGELGYSITTDVGHASFCHELIAGERDPVEW